MPGRVMVTIDGREIEATAGELVIKVAQDHGVYIPRFCWHERMKPVGMCRMCLVEIEGARGLPPACTATVTDGMVVRTDTPAVTKAQEGVLEFLLINHPLDCPVCDKGGECPLQDHTLGFGPGESRFVEEKRHFAKPIPLSALVHLDRERCIQCARCTRFAEEVAGDPLITFVERGASMQVLTHPDEPFSSYFSGNTVQICPVGALLATPYRFRARPWDLSSVESSCQMCAVGCRIAIQSSANELVRHLGVDSEAVNHGWLCDKGRFAYEWVHAADRWTEPMVRQAPAGDGQARGDLVEATWPEALEAAAAGLSAAIDRDGPGAVAVIGGARGTNEDAYVWARFAKGVLRTDNVDGQLGDGLPAEVVTGLRRATLAACDTARAIVLLGPDLKEELPVAYLRLKRAAGDLGVPLIEISATPTGLSRLARVRLAPRPGAVDVLASRLTAAVSSGEPTGDTDLDAAAGLLRAGDGEIIVVLGRASLAEPVDATVRAATALAELPDVWFLSALRRGNVHGALDLGLAPGMLPGRVTLDAGRAWYSAAWGGVPAARGLDTEGVLRAAAEGRISALVLLGADPVSDFPDTDLARRALERVGFVVAVDAFATASSQRADVVLPAAVFGEKRGTTTNLEGRVLRLSRKITPRGAAMEDWRVAVELAARFGAEIDLEAVDEVTDEIARLAPAHRGVDAAVLRRAIDGVVVPMGEREEPLFDAPRHAVSPQADPDAGLTGGPIESLVTIGGPATAWGATEPEGVAPQPGSQAPEAASGAAAIGGWAAPPPGGPLEAPPGDPPPLHRWDGQPSGGDRPSPDGGGLRLVAGRRLYDAGVIVTKTLSLTPLAAPPEARIHPSEADRLGLSAGATVRVSSPRGSLTLPLRTDPGLAPGVVQVPFNAWGEGAGQLVDAASVTEVRVEAAPNG